MGQLGHWPEATLSNVVGTAVFVFGPFQLNLAERSLQRHGVPVPLGSRAFDILAVLVQRAGQVVKHDELIAHVWADVRVSPGTPRVHMTALRKALGCGPDRTRYIANVQGRGYCFVASDLTPVASERPIVNGKGRVVPPGVKSAPMASLPGPKSHGLEPSSEAADQFDAKRGLQASATAANVAEHFLATPNTPDPPPSGNIASHRKRDAKLGWDIAYGASTSNGSLAAREPHLMPTGEDPEMNRNRLAVAAAITLLTCVADAGFGRAQSQRATGNGTHYRTATVDGISVFYREAGPPSGPVVVLLHGFPTSSHMFRNLIPTLADRYHVIAPDYPGFGQSAAPDHAQFAYTFARYASLVDALLQQLGATRYAMYVMDYGAPVGYRLALLHPERVTALVVQNGNAYAEGLDAFWDPIKAYWADGSEAHRQALDFLVAPETTKFQYTDGVSDVSRISPDNWVRDQALLDRPGNRDIQLDLFLDYGTNVPLYPEFQAFFRKHQPPTLIVWGKNDKIFPAAGAGPYLRDLPKAELHLLDTGHFALEDKLDVMAPMIRDFLDRSIAPK